MRGSGRNEQKWQQDLRAKWLNGFAGFALVFLAVWITGCRTPSGPPEFLEIDAPSDEARQELLTACGYDAVLDRLTRCEEFEFWYREALAVCVGEEED